MEKFKNIIIGFGKGGKTLAKNLAKKGETVLMIEGSDQMYGGTCINIGCIPSKSLIVNSERHLPFSEAVSHRGVLTAALRNKNYHMVADEPTATVWTGWASFTSNHELVVTFADGSSKAVTGERIFINTGSTPIIPEIPGLTLGKQVVTSKEIMELPQLPEKLTILGAGYIGLEFASMFANYGSQVTVIDTHSDFMPKEDPEIAELVKERLTNQGVTFHLGVTVKEVQTDKDSVAVFYDNQSLTSDILLVATGRKPNTAQLHLENTEIATTPRGAIQVNERLQTNVENIWALGDVNGGLQFTYISLDDFRIVMDQLFGAGKRSTKDRNVIPYSVFLTPPLSRVGLSETELKAQKIDYKLFSMPTASVPKAHVLEDAFGTLKIMVAPSNHQILGAVIYAEDSHEIINIVALAMKAGLPYEILRDQIYAHPTMAEALNDLLS